MNFLQRIKKIYYPLVKLVTQRSNKFGQVLVAPNNKKAQQPFHALQAQTINGQSFSFEQLKGKKTMLVNVASNCGFTAQYDELKALHKQYPSLQILGFPANDFGGQEPGSDQEIVNFCRMNFGVSFPLFHKLPVTGNKQQPVYQWLTHSNQNGWNDKAPQWNFFKYLVNEQGELTHVWGSAVSPMSKEIQQAIQL